jgi:glyoxalase family protein
VDEPFERLGSALTLPPWLEDHRSHIERALPPLRLPGISRGKADAAG